MATVEPTPEQIYIDGESFSCYSSWEPYTRYYSSRISIIDGVVNCDGKPIYYNGVAVSENDTPIASAQYTTTPPPCASSYIGVEGIARKVKSIYIGVDNIARKVLKGYIGVDGVARLWYAGANLIEFTIYSVDTLLPLYTYNAEVGMTWEQWVNSEYNTDGFYVNGETINGTERKSGIMPNTSDVRPSDVIDPSTQYYQQLHTVVYQKDGPIVIEPILP